MGKSTKHKRYNIVDLHKNCPKKFGRFIMALKNLINSEDWGRICGIHGNTFNPNDHCVKCPTDPQTVTKIGNTGEPFYCKHSVYSFIGWHAPYIYQYELLLNKYNKSKCKKYITLPWLDLNDYSSDYSFINDPEITITYDCKVITTENPLSTAYYYVDGKRTRITRNGYLTPTNEKERIQLNTVKNQLNDALHASNYEEFSSANNLDVPYTPLETPHNSLHNIIGGPEGNMTAVNISAFDPLFWMHHCNMDRYYYSWYSNMTDNFTKPLYPNYISESSLNKPCAPFFKENVYSANWNDYSYGWKNGTGSYAKLSDVIDISKFPYTYDIIKPLLKSQLNAYILLKDISVPQESVEINAYIYLKGEKLDRNKDFAGSVFWFGINQQKIYCKRCKTTLTNLKININDFVAKNNINESNIGDYEILLEGRGLLVKHPENGSYKKYLQKEILKKGKISVVVPK